MKLLRRVVVRVQPFALGCCVAVSLANCASAGRLFLSDSPMAPTPGVNPTINLPEAGLGKIYVWAELGSSESIPGLAYDVVNTFSGIATAISHLVDNPVILGNPRWNVINNGTLGQLVTGSNFVRLGGGPNGAFMSLDPLYDAGTGAYRIAEIDLQAASAGTSEVFLQIGAQGIALGNAGDPLFLGWGDAAVANNAFGFASNLADATITVAGVKGDFDNDGDVDGADFLAWQRGFNDLYTGQNLADWKMNFGNLGPLVASSTIAVPEPSSWGFLLTTMGPALARRRRIASGCISHFARILKSRRVCYQELTGGGGVLLKDRWFSYG